MIEDLTEKNNRKIKN